MNDNVIKFQKPKPQKQPRHTPPWLKRVLMLVAVVAAFIAVYAYFIVSGSGASPPV